jgi:hypothetical protein
MTKGLVLAASAVVGLGLLGAAAPARADAIPYQNIGTPNPVTYSFTAKTTGDLIAYFAGSTATYDNQLGVLVNGVAQGGYGLDNHSSSVGEQYDFGLVTAGSTLVFVLHNLTLGNNAYSDPSLNVAYDLNGSDGHNHLYSTAYTATSPVLNGIPAGTFFAFEDLPFPYSDFNYNDEDFVFLDVATKITSDAGFAADPIPEPAALVLFGAGLAGLRLVRRRRA